MSTPGKRIAERIAALPEGDQAGIEEAALEYIDRLVQMKAALARSEADIKAGRVKSINEVFDPLIAKYGP